MTYHIYCRILAYVVTIVMHASNVAVMMNSFHGEPMKNKEVRHFSEMQVFFFTCWTFMFQTVYAAFGLYIDILTLKKSNSSGYKLPKLLVDCRDAFFNIFVWPCTVLVFGIFWPFFYYDRGLFFPQDIDLAISSTSNQIMHAYILPLTLWEAFFRRRTMPKHHKLELVGVWLIAVTYFATLFGVHAVKGVWVYPIFGIISGSILFYMFFVFIMALLPFIYYAQWAFNKIVWGSNKQLKKVH